MNRLPIGLARRIRVELSLRIREERNRIGIARVGPHRRDGEDEEAQPKATNHPDATS